MPVDDAFGSRLRHDLRTPINAVKGYGEMLLEDAQGPAAAEFVDDLQKMLEATERLLPASTLLSSSPPRNLILLVPPSAAWASRAPELLHLVPGGDIGRRHAEPARRIFSSTINNRTATCCRGGLYARDTRSSSPRTARWR